MTIAEGVCLFLVVIGSILTIGVIVLLMDVTGMGFQPRWPRKIPAQVVGRPLSEVETRFGEPHQHHPDFGNEWDGFYFVTAAKGGVQYHLAVDVNSDTTVKQAKIFTWGQ